MTGGMGCWAMGGMWWGNDVNDDDSVAAVGAALDCGVNFFDTAPLYGYGLKDLLFDGKKSTIVVDRGGQILDFDVPSFRARLGGLASCS